MLSHSTQANSFLLRGPLPPAKAARSEEKEMVHGRMGKLRCKPRAGCSQKLAASLNNPRSPFAVRWPSPQTKGSALGLNHCEGGPTEGGQFAIRRGAHQTARRRGAVLWGPTNFFLLRGSLPQRKAAQSKEEKNDPRPQA